MARKAGGMGRRGSTLALGYNLHHLGGSLLYSVPRFHTELVITLLGRGAFRHLWLIATPFAPRLGQKAFEHRPTVQAILRHKPRAVTVELTDYPTLAAHPGPPPSVLHDGSWQDLVRPFRLRRLLAHDRFPITVSHHGLTPGDTLRTFGLDLLLSDSRPHDAIICTSRAARSVIRAFMEHVREALRQSLGAAPTFAGRLEVIAPGVNPLSFRPRAKGPARRRLGLPADALILLFFGRFDFGEKADLLPLLRVLRFVIDDSPGVQLLFVGAGRKGPPEQEDLFCRYAAELGVSAHVRRLTEIAPEDDPLLYAAADIFVCPADCVSENFGLAPVQAMACGVPQVASDWDGHRDTIVHGETGFLVPAIWGPCDPGLSLQASFLDWEPCRPLSQTTAIDLRALREHLGALVRNDALRKAMARRSRERACALFSLQHVASQYEALWGELGAMARAHRADPQPWTDIRRAPLLELYRGQVTDMLDGSTRLRLSETGARVLEGLEAMPMPSFEPSVVNKTIAIRLLGALMRRPRGHPANAVVRAVARTCRRTHDAVWCNVMWLMKYGYVEHERSHERR